MRIIRSPSLRAVIRVKRRGIVAVAIPDSLPRQEILELASLVLSTSEYEAFRDVVESAADRAGEPAADRDPRIGVGIALPRRPVD